jgi:TRAP-type C4-dicarboxylate transport system permease small subunit
MMQLYERIGKIELLIAKFALATLTALVLLSAVARSIHQPVAWAVDAATFLFAWCVFLGSDYAMRNDKLVTIDIIVSRLPLKARYYIKLVNQVIIIIFLAALVGFGFYLSYTTRLRAFQGMPAISYTWVTLSVPIGSLLMLTTTILKVKEQISLGYRNLRTTETKEFI